MQLSSSPAPQKSTVKIGNPMTNTEIGAIESGPVCDRAVSVAIGRGPKCICGPCKDAYDPLTGECFRCGLRVPKHYSTDWNDAMYAAERFGLFVGADDARVLGCQGGMWEVWYVDVWQQFDHKIASAPTGPLAICRAILKLSSG